MPIRKDISEDPASKSTLAIVSKPEKKSKKERPSAFLFFPRQFAGDEQVMGMTLDAIGAHILLLCAAAASPERYRIPYRTDTEKIRLRMILRYPDDTAFERLKAQLLCGAWKLSEDGNWWEQDGLRRTFEKQAEFSAKQSERVQKRWKKADTAAIPQSESGIQKTYSKVKVKDSYSTAVNNNNTHTSTITVEAEAERLAQYFHQLVEANPHFNEESTPKDWEGLWSQDFEKLLETYSYEDCTRLIDESQSSRWAKFNVRAAVLLKNSAKLAEQIGVASKQASEDTNEGFELDEDFS